MDSQVKVLTVIFSGAIKPQELAAFRGAFIEKVGREHFLFHNHLEDRFRYGYPLIQYKRIQEQPGLICLDIGVDEIHHFFSHQDWSLCLKSGKILEMKINHLNLDQYPLALSPTQHSYRISDWVALNQKNFDAYLQLQTAEEQKDFLTQKLIGNILSYARGIGWQVDGRVEVALQGPIRSRPLLIKGVQLLGFQVNFTCNLWLPPYLGLGGKVSLGHGMVVPAPSRRIVPKSGQISRSQPTQPELLPL